MHNISVEISREADFKKCLKGLPTRPQKLLTYLFGGSSIGHLWKTANAVVDKWLYLVSCESSKFICIPTLQSSCLRNWRKCWAKLHFTYTEARLETFVEVCLPEIVKFKGKEWIRSISIGIINKKWMHIRNIKETRLCWATMEQSLWDFFFLYI